MSETASRPLNVTHEAQHRVLVGLGWDPKEKSNILEKVGEMVGGKKAYFDLDLACVFYAADKTLLGRVSSAPEELVGANDAIYHSGDSVEGFGGDDDEQISVELKNLPKDICHILFIASIKSGHSFKDVPGAMIRLADGYSNHNFYELSLSGAEALGKNAFIFVVLSREGQSGWRFKPLSDYCDSAALNSPESLAERHLP